MFPETLGTILHLGCLAATVWLTIAFCRHPDLVRFAINSLLRRRGFTTILLVTIFVCSLSLLAMGGYFQQSFWGLSESTIRGQTGHFQVMRNGYQAHSRTDPWNWKLRNLKALQNLFASDTFLAARIEVVAPELAFSGLLSNGQTSHIFMGRAVSPTADRKLSAFGEDIAQGRRFSDADRDQALLGQGLAQALEARPGTGLTLLTTTPRGSLASVDLDVSGVTESFSREYDDVSLKISLSSAWAMLGDTLCDKVLVLLHQSHDLDTVLARTRELALARGLDFEFRSWGELAPYYNSVVVLYTGIFRFFGTVLVLFSLVFISSILEIAILQRRGEIALLRAFGASPRTLLRRYMAESVLLGLVGTAVAVGLALGVIALFNLHGLQAAPPPGSSRGYRIVLRVFEEPQFVLQVYEFVSLTVIASTLLPVWRGCHRALLESLRHG